MHNTSVNKQLNIVDSSPASFVGPEGTRGLKPYVVYPCRYMAGGLQPYVVLGYQLTRELKPRVVYDLW